MKIAVIGGGISGLSIARMQQKGNDVVVYEKESRPGGLIKCSIVEGSLYHQTGGHVFNTKRQDVWDWFDKLFDREKEFKEAFRNSVVAMPDQKMIPYPVENHVYMFEEPVVKQFIYDLLNMVKVGQRVPANFEEFLRNQFGETLYRLYFQPYNRKVWHRELTQIPLSWLEGKLPMPTVEEMIYNNMNHVEERDFVHSSFFYPLQGGSQFLADRLAEGLNVVYGTCVSTLQRTNKKKWLVNGESFDCVIFCGNLKQLPTLLTESGNLIQVYEKEIKSLESHGTTSVFCEIDKNDYSWIYMPDDKYEAHRIICTGNFSENNNAIGKMTGTVEFTDFISKEGILSNLERMPYHPKYLAHHYEQYTYPIQNSTTRAMISELKKELRKENMFLLGRFAEWEYYNMDVAIGAALDLNKLLQYDEVVL